METIPFAEGSLPSRSSAMCSASFFFSGSQYQMFIDKLYEMRSVYLEQITRWLVHHLGCLLIWLESRGKLSIEHLRIPGKKD